MPGESLSPYHRIILAIDDARIALDDVLAESETARLLPQREWDTLRRLADELRTLQDRLAHEAEDVTRDRHVDHLLADVTRDRHVDHLLADVTRDRHVDH